METLCLISVVSFKEIKTIFYVEDALDANGFKVGESGAKSNRASCNRGNI